VQATMNLRTKLQFNHRYYYDSPGCASVLVSAFP